MDNLQQLIDYKDTVIDPALPPGGITAENHNELEDRMIKTLGKYAGYPFNAGNNPPAGIVSLGTFYWNANSMNNTANFFIFVAAQTLDGYTSRHFVYSLTEGDKIKFKDFKGRASIFDFVAYSIVEDAAEPTPNTYFRIEVKGYSDNPNYTYQNDETLPCVIEIINYKSQLPSHPIGYKFLDKGWKDGVKNSDYTQFQANDIFVPGATAQGVVQMASVWKGNDLSDPNDYVNLLEIGIEPENQNF